jgi:hypothetical protein
MKNKFKGIIIYLLERSTIISILSITLLLYILNDYRNTIISGDAEPDYIANAYSILNSWKPIGYHHPGTINYYFLSLILYVIKIFKLNLWGTIIVARICYWILLLVIVIKTIKLNYQKEYILKLIICILIFIATPELRELVFKISAEALIFPLTILFYNYFTKNRYIKLSILFGIILNIKFSCILLLPIFFVSIKNESTYKKLKYIILVLGVYIITTYPTSFSFHSTFLPLFQTIIRLDAETALLIPSKYYLIPLYRLIIRGAVLTSIILLIIIFVKNEKKYCNLSGLDLVKLFITFFVILFIFNNQSLNYRHFVPLIVFSVYYLNLNVIILNFKQIIIIYIVTIILLFASSVKVLAKEKQIDNYIKNQNKTCYIFQASNFTSEIIFMKWAEYRYGNSNNILPKEWYSGQGIKSDKIIYLNTRNSESIIKNSNEFVNQLFSSMYSYRVNLDSQLNEIIEKELIIIIDKSQYEEFNKIIYQFINKNHSRYKLHLISNNENYYSYILD